MKPAVRYSRELGDEICRRLANGESLLGICTGDDMPWESAVRNWVVVDVDGFAARYAYARETGYHHMAEEIVRIADDGRGDTWTDEDGNEVVNSDHINRSKLRVDARKWLLSKMLPKTFGDKVDLAHSGSVTLESLILSTLQPDPPTDK